jgi:ribosomal-protein-alanine N-acetyltransferase
MKATPAFLAPAPQCRSVCKDIVSDDRSFGSRVADQWFRTAPSDPTAWYAQAPVLRGPDVTLREATRADAFALFAIVSDPRVAAGVVHDPKSPAHLAEMIDAAAFDRRSRRGIWMSIVLNTSRLAGLVRLREIEPGFGSADWEIVLAPEQWGSGLFVRSASTVIDLAFDALGANRLEARIAASNVRAQAAFRKLGAAQEAVLRRSVQLARGSYDDQILVTLFADDWRERREIIRHIH